MNTKTMSHFFIFFIHILISLNGTYGHGRLQEPPSRSTMWRYGFDNPLNYNDHELYCGGLARQIQNRGRCGVCGDPWDSPIPRPNEDGGKYGRGIIVRTYSPGQTIDVVVDITANHRGFFEFKLCPVTKHTPVDDECMTKNILSLADGSGTRYILPNSRNEKFPLKLVLPKGLTCQRCVFQWTYTAGNNWGICKDGPPRVGCGPQETFRACADISIMEETNDISGNNIRQKLHHQKLKPDTDMSVNEINGSSSLANGLIKLFLLTVTVALIFAFI